MKELQKKAPNEIDWMQKLDNAQQRLLKLANNTINQYNKTSTHMELAELEADAKKIICEPFANGVCVARWHATTAFSSSYLRSDLQR